jgi:hypothetical protein
MTQISSTFNATRPTPRIANYIAALIREGDKFDYCKWLRQVREQEAQAKELRQAITERISSEEMIFDGRKVSPNRRLFSGHTPIQIGMTCSRRKTSRSTSDTRITRRCEEIRDAWNAFQANRARDAVYGYLEAVFAIVQHYKVRRRTKKLLRHAFKFVEFPFVKNADPFRAVIRCTCGDAADDKTISKCARALRYVARCKVPPKQSKAFMKEAGGVNACANGYAKYVGGRAK